jgi:3-dehydro-L-gulonate 2-dehydrogenase
MAVASSTGISLISLADTNHWMRGGTYGWHAARKGFILICWTNTEANMPAWGATDPRIGNNPLIIAVPYGNEAIVLDFALTQYSYGKLETYKMAGEKLPWPGGFDQNGRLTDDPEIILATRRALPIGFWKGSGISLLLDILAAVISGGSSTYEITGRGVEYRLSQVFIAINPMMLANYKSINSAIDGIINDYKSSQPVNENNLIRYPGENILKTRELNSRKGIPVSRKMWETISSL